MKSDVINIETESKNKIDQELLSYRKYLKYKRNKQISTGNYNWLIIDPFNVNCQNLIEKIRIINHFNNISSNIISDSQYFTLKYGFDESGFLTSIKFGERISNVLVISSFSVSVALAKFGKFCTFLADFSNEKIIKTTPKELEKIIKKSSFNVQNMSILESLCSLPKNEADRILTKAQIKALNNDTTILDNYIDVNNNTNLYITELEELIGLEKAKKTVKEIVNYLEIAKKRDDIPCLNMCFLGNPGTGKTTVAKLVGKILGELHILSFNAPFVEVSRETLVGKYVRSY